MKILALDPSSTKTGYAVLADSRAPNPRLLDAGILWPRQKDGPPLQRITDQVNELSAILREHQPDLVVVEEPSGHVAGRIKKAGRQMRGLAVYGAAVGGFWIFLNMYRELLEPTQKTYTLIAVKENVWTRGVPKGERQNIIAMSYPTYKPKADKGADVADAVGLAQWVMASWQKSQLAIAKAKEAKS